MDARKFVGILQDILRAKKREFKHKQPVPIQGKKQDVEYLCAMEAQYALNHFESLITKLCAIPETDFSQAHLDVFIANCTERESIIENTPADFYADSRSLANSLYLNAAQFFASYAKSSGLGEKTPYRLLLPVTLPPYSDVETDENGYLATQTDLSHGYLDLKNRLLKRVGVKAYSDRDHLINHLAFKVKRVEWDGVLKALMDEQALYGNDGMREPTDEEIKEYKEKVLQPFSGFVLHENGISKAVKNPDLYTGNLRHDYAVIFLFAKLYQSQRALQPQYTGRLGAWTGYDRDTKLTALGVLKDYLTAQDDVETFKDWDLYLANDLPVFIKKKMADELNERANKAVDAGELKADAVVAYKEELVAEEVKNITGAAAGSTIGLITDAMKIIFDKYESTKSDENALTEVGKVELN